MFGSVFLVLAALTSGHLYSIDGLNYYRAAVRLVFDRSFVFDPPLVWDPSISGVVPSGPIGYSLAYIPALLLAAPLSGDVPPFTTQPFDQRLLYADPMYAAASWVAPAIVAGIATLTYVLARRCGGSARLSIVGALAAVFASPLLFYARADFAQPLSALLLLAGILAVVDIRQGRGRTILVVPIVAGAVLVRPIDGTMLAAIALAGLVVPGSPGVGAARRRIADVALPAAGFALGLSLSLLSNWFRSGRPFDYGYGQGFTGDLLHGMAAHLVSPGRGLLWYAPIIVLATLGIVRLWRARRWVELTLLLSPLLLYLPLYAMWAGLGGWSWGPRFLVPVVAPLVVLAVIAVAGRSWALTHATFAVLVIVGVAANLGHLLVDPLQGYWGAWGDSIYGTPGYERQFELGAYPPIGIWDYYRPESFDELTDLAWLKLADDTGGVSLLPPIAYVVVAVGLLTLAWRAGSPARGGRADPRGAASLPAC